MSGHRFPVHKHVLEKNKVMFVILYCEVYILAEFLGVPAYTVNGNQ